MRTTHSARAGAAALGFDFPGMIAAVMNLTMADFYKSMTTHAEAGCLPASHPPAGRVYLKLTVLDDVLIVSFKEL